MNTQQLGASLGAVLSKTQWRLRCYFQQRLNDAGLNITVEQWSVLAAIDTSEATQSDIARRIEKDKANVTRMIDLLESKGLVERTLVSNDRRRHCIRLTAQGKAMVGRIIPIAKDVNAIGLNGLSVRDKEMLLKILDTIKQNYD